MPLSSAATALGHRIDPKLGNRRGWGRWAVLAVRFLDLRAHFLETLALVHHFHHVTRDADADPSSQAHAVKF
jgi:hypothetical protein